LIVVVQETVGPALWNKVLLNKKWRDLRPKKTNIKLATELLGIDRIRREGCRS
jgi:hypothetical protein